MQLLVTMQSLGRKRPVIQGVPFTLATQPHTLRALLMESVSTCVQHYNARLMETELPLPMSEERLDAMACIGKLAFGMSYGGREADLQEAILTALQAFQDGQVRVFRGAEELTDLDAPLALRENDAVTFIRLTFLTGGIY